ncbi:putative endonuclease [Gammaproteobacteria bacterium]
MAIQRAVSEKNNRTACGRQAENRARHFLETRGLSLLACNYRAPCGELDLIMRDGMSVVFIEVRLRRSSRFGDAVESVNARKCARITATAAHYLQRHRELANQPCRFDVVAFSGPNEIAEPRWLKGAFGV